jgi:probable rRNA maturation factor
MSPDDTTVLFSRAGKAVPRSEIREFGYTLQREVTGGRWFTCLITDDLELQRLNRDFLGKDYPTDVLSFPSGQPEGNLGEIAISVGRAHAQALEHRHSLGQELKILMLHGVLHLLGMDHETDRGAMERFEKHWRRQLALNAGLIERARA